MRGNVQLSWTLKEIPFSNLNYFENLTRKCRFFVCVIPITCQPCLNIPQYDMYWQIYTVVFLCDDGGFMMANKLHRQMWLFEWCFTETIIEKERQRIDERKWKLYIDFKLWVQVLSELFVSCKAVIKKM